MLERYRVTLERLHPGDRSILHTHLELNTDLPLAEALAILGFDQATVVLTLLHAGRHGAVELLIGRPITVYPPQLTPQRNLPLPRREPVGDERRITVSVPECPLTIPSARQRWDLMRSCRTVQGYLNRVPRWRALRDLREWGAAGWLEVA